MAKCSHSGIKVLKPLKKRQYRFKCRDCGKIWVFMAPKDDD